MPKRESLSSFQMIPIPEEEAPEADALLSRQRFANKRLIVIILAAIGLVLVLALSCVIIIRPPWLMSGSTPRTETTTSPRTGTLTSHATSQAYLPVIFQSTSAGVSETTPISATTQIPAPSPTPGSGSGFHLVIAVQKDESVFMMNQGTIDLPLNLIQLGTDQGKVLGEEWKVDLLKPGQCVGVWKEGSLPFPPANIKCKIVGEQLKRSGSSSFWKSEFNVYYHDLLVGTCNKDQAVCEFIFPNIP